MRAWTEEERRRHGELIRRWQPWKTAGVKTPEGKARSRMNAVKHGRYAADVKAMRRMLRQSHALIRRTNALLLEGRQKALALRKAESRHYAMAVRLRDDHERRRLCAIPPHLYAYFLKNNTSANRNFLNIEERIIKAWAAQLPTARGRPPRISPFARPGASER